MKYILAVSFIILVLFSCEKEEEKPSLVGTWRLNSVRTFNIDSNCIPRDYEFYAGQSNRDSFYTEFIFSSDGIVTKNEYSYSNMIKSQNSMYSTNGNKLYLIDSVGNRLDTFKTEYFLEKSNFAFSFSYEKPCPGTSKLVNIQESYLFNRL